MRQITPNQFIKEQREKMNLTQEEFSLLAEVSTRTVGKWEGGETEPSKNTLNSLCNKIGLIPLWDIFNNLFILNDKEEQKQLIIQKIKTLL